MFSGGSFSVRSFSLVWRQLLTTSHCGGFKGFGSPRNEAAASRSTYSRTILWTWVGTAVSSSNKIDTLRPFRCRSSPGSSPGTVWSPSNQVDHSLLCCHSRTNTDLLADCSCQETVFSPSKGVKGVMPPVPFQQQQGIGCDKSATILKRQSPSFTIKLSTFCVIFHVC
jgi:hypothetical protein